MKRCFLSFVLATALAGQNDPAQLGRAGEQALRNGDIDAAETAFRELVKLHPEEGGAHANLGVVYMRRARWDRARMEFETAAKLLPNVPGIRLNIGLADFRMNRFDLAIAPFASVVRDDPASTQARYLLGLCYFLTEQYGNASETLEPLWGGQSSNLQYLYVVGIAAGKANRPDLEQRALGKLSQVGQNSPEVHLLMGKALLARDREADALRELQEAERGNPRLPFVHYFMGMVYRRQNDLPRALGEFRKDAEIEPDVAFNYEALGQISPSLEESETYFRKALILDANSTASYYGLGKTLKKVGRNAEALTALDRVIRLDPTSASAHYLRAQLLQSLKRSSDAKVEFGKSAELRKEQRDKLEREISGEQIVDPNPGALLDQAQR